MADLFTEGLGAAGRVSESREQRSERDPGSGKRRRPVKPIPRNVETGDDESMDDPATPAHRVDRLA